MNTGVVKFFNDPRGFGFIKDNETERDIFVHITGVLEDIKEGDQVLYNITEGKKGPMAIDVKLNN